MKIERFKGDYNFLSNFYDSIIVIDGLEYRTVEHAFQAAKTDDPEWKENIRNARTPGESKRLGRKAYQLSPYNCRPKPTNKIFCI